MRTSDNQPTTKSPQGGLSAKRKKVKLPRYSRLNKKLVYNLDLFIEAANTERLSRSLRNLFLLYLSHEKDGIPEELEDTIVDIYFLLEFLDNASEELRSQSTGGKE